MRILVLGGTGAMGVPLVNILAKRGHKVDVTTRKSRQSSNENITYIVGNAHENEFLNEILASNYDAIIDFMNYSTAEFEKRYDLLLNKTKHYLFLSSARVYADSKTPITENSARLLDITDDQTYLKTEEYALAKAREEDFLFNSEKKNWTIIRPYITYNNERLQLGVFEKEHWLYRALLGKKIVFSKDIASCTTTLTFGEDVALRIADLVGCEEAKAEAFHITTDQTITWGDVLEIYRDVLEQYTGRRPEVFWLENFALVEENMNCHYQIHCDRLYNRVFDNSKIQRISSSPYRDVREGITQCLLGFCNEEKKYRNILWEMEARFNKRTGENIPLCEIPTMKKRIKYLLYRYILP